MNKRKEKETESIKYKLILKDIHKLKAKQNDITKIIKFRKQELSKSYEGFKNKLLDNF